MGIYTEKREQLIEKIKGLEMRIASGTADNNSDNADLFADSFLRKSDYLSDNN